MAPYKCKNCPCNWSAWRLCQCNRVLLDCEATAMWT